MPTSNYIKGILFRSTYLKNQYFYHEQNQLIGSFIFFLKQHFSETRNNTTCLQNATDNIYPRKSHLVGRRRPYGLLPPTRAAQSLFLQR